MDLGTRARSALRWSAGGKLTGQLFTWAMTLIVIRLLTPEDYGLMAIAVLFIQFLMLLNEFGLGAVLVHRKNLDEETKRKIFGVILLINTTFFIIINIAATWIADFFHEKELILIIHVLSIQFIISAFEIVPVAMLERELNFKKKSLVYLGASVVGGTTTLVLALYDFGVWSLIWGNLTVITLQVCGINIVSPFLKLPSFNFKGMMSIMSFGWLVTLERAMWFFYTQADILIVGKILGKEILGVYSVAMHLASLIMHKTGGILYEVAFPTFSRANEAPGEVAGYFLKAVRLMSFISFPIFFGMSSIAPELVGVVLGEKWKSAGMVLMILALVMPLRMLSNIFPPVLQGVGRPGQSVVNLIIGLIVMPIAFWFGARWGILGVSIAWLIGFPLVFMMAASRSIAFVGVNMKEFLVAIIPPALTSSLMYAVIMGVKVFISGDDTSVFRLLILILVGALTFIPLALTVHRSQFREVREFFKR